MIAKSRAATKRIVTKISDDKSTSKVVLGFFFLYILLFGYFRFYSVYAVPLNLATLTVLIPIFLTDVIKVAIESLSKKHRIKTKENLRKVSVIIPTYNGSDTIEETIKSLLRRIAADRIIIASNGSTDDTCEKARRLGVRVLDMPEPVGKVVAINKALHMVRTQFTLIMDDDTIIGRAQIPTGLLEQGNSGVAFRVLPTKGSWVATLQTHEYRKSMDIGRGFHNITGTVQTISGAIGLFYTKELIRQVDLHTGEFSGEDLQRTLLILADDTSGGVVISDSTVLTHVPQTVRDLFRQRVLGWYPGFFANIGIYFKLLFKKHTPFRLRVEAFYNIFVVLCIDPLRMMSLPTLLFSPIFMVIFYIIYVILEMFPYFATGRKEPFWVVLLTPFYGIINSMARFMAFAVFIYRRLTYYIARANHLDDYRHVPLLVRCFGVMWTVSFFMVFFSIYSFLFIVPPAVQQNVKHAVADDVSEVQHRFLDE